jgi:SAM-dependent methyltransferase
MNEQSSLHRPIGDLPISQLLSESQRLNQWLYQLIRKCLKGKVLEIGSGQGTLSSLFVQDGFALRISDPDRSNCAFLQEKFNGEPMIKGVHQLDLAIPTFGTTYSGFIERFDTLVAINAMEQNEDETLILNNAKSLLRHRGRLVILLPAHIALYEESEIGFGQWRRLNRSDIRQRLGKDWEVLHTQFFAVSAINPSSDTSDNRDLQGENSETRYHQNVPSFCITDEKFFNQAGLYIFTVARKISV